MSMTLDERLQSLVDGSASPEEVVALEKILATNEAARMLYIDIVEIHSRLEQRSHFDPHPGKIISMDRVLARQRRRTMRIAGLCGVAALIIAGIFAVNTLLPVAPVASFKAQPDSRFALVHAFVDGKGAPEGRVLEVGSRLKLTRGTLQIQFESGVSSVVRAPADLTVQTKDHILLDQGTARFEVPEEAIGFKVETPEFLLTDLGTEFGIISRPETPDVAHVIDGSVEVLSKSGSRPSQTLVASQARQINGDGDWEVVPFSTAAFYEKLPVTPALPSHLYWSFDELVDGAFPVDGSHRSLPHISPLVPKGDPNVALSSGRVGQALKISTPGQHLVTDWRGISGNRPRTVAFWLKIPEGGFEDAQVLGWGNWDRKRNGQWSFRVTNDRYLPDDVLGRKRLRTKESRVMLVLGDCWFLCEKNIDDGQWHHVAATYRGSVDSLGRPIVTLYLDGEKAVSEYHSWTPESVRVNTYTRSANSSPLMIGLRTAVRDYFTGEIDELYIFESHLSETEIYALAHPEDD